MNYSRCDIKTFVFQVNFTPCCQLTFQQVNVPPRLRCCLCAPSKYVRGERGGAVRFRGEGGHSVTGVAFKKPTVFVTLVMLKSLNHS